MEMPDSPPPNPPARTPDTRAGPLRFCARGEAGLPQQAGRLGLQISEVCTEHIIFQAVNTIQWNAEHCREWSAIILSPTQKRRNPFSFWTDGFQRRRLSSEQSLWPQHKSLHFVGFSRLFFPILREQQLAFARALICQVFSTAHTDHNYTVHVQISCEVILPSGVTRLPQIKEGTTVFPSAPALARLG